MLPATTRAPLSRKKVYLGHSDKYLLCSLHSILFQVLLVSTVHSDPIPSDSHAYTHYIYIPKSEVDLPLQSINSSCTIQAAHFLQSYPFDVSNLTLK